jgi:hypothetical protein
LASRLLRNMPLLRLLKLQLLSRHSTIAAPGVETLCLGRRVEPCPLLSARAPLFEMRGAVHRMERALQLMVDAHVNAPVGMHVIVAGQ